MFEIKNRARNKLRFNLTTRLKLRYAYAEPDGWPLIRPATSSEWAHVLRVMLMRRIPKYGSIHVVKLIHYVSDDILAASVAGRIYVDPYFTKMRQVYGEFSRMVKAKTVRIDPGMQDPEMIRDVPAASRTDYTEQWLSLIPATVKAVVDYLPVTNVLDLMVQALVDDD